jgi:hypothetical protein
LPTSDGRACDLLVAGGGIDGDRGSAMVALTAERSRMMPLAKEAMRLVLASLSHSSTSDAVFLRFIAWNLSVRPGASNHSRGGRFQSPAARLGTNGPRLCDWAFLELTELYAG